MTSSPKLPQKALLEINRNLLIYLFTILMLAPPAANLVMGRLDQTTTDSSGSIVWQIIELLVFANCIIIARSFGVKTKSVFFCMLPFLGLLIWALLSVTWSEYPDLTARRAPRLVVEVAAAVLLALFLPTSQGVLRILFRIFFIINLADIISIAFPSISQTDLGFAGVHGLKNLAGEFLYMAMPVFFIGILDRSISRSRSAALFALLTAAGMLVASQSKTAIGAGLIATAFVLGSRVARSKRYRAVFWSLSVPLALSLVLLVFQGDLAETLSNLYGDPTLTGRDQLWQFALSKYESSPLTGVGYGALWGVGPQLQLAFGERQILAGVVNEAHNGYIDILAQTGIVGLLLLISSLLMILVRIYRYASFSEGCKGIGLADYAIYIFWGGLIYNVTETFSSCLSACGSCLSSSQPRARVVVHKYFRPVINLRE